MSDGRAGAVPGTGHGGGGAAGAETIQVVVGCDDGYARHLAVMLLSLFAHSRTLPVRVHVMVSPAFASRGQLDEAMGEHAGKLTYYRVATGAVPGPVDRTDITAATYYRLLIGDVLPADLDRVIYLDCDMLVCCDVVDLWRQPLGAAVVGAVNDPGFEDHGALGIPSGSSYFNAGLLLINMKAWRGTSVGSEALAFRVAHPERITYDDQCALNWVLRGRWAKLDDVWNAQIRAFADLTGKGVRYFHPVPAAGQAARVVHFNCPGRPWMYMDEHPFKPAYLRYQAQTPWRGERPADRYPHNIIIKTLRRHAPPLLPVYNFLRKYV